MIPNEYYLLIHKSLTGEITRNEEALLSSWLKEDPANQETMDELRMVWDAASDAEDFNTPDEIHIQKQRERLDKNLAEAKKGEAAHYRSAILYRNMAIFALIIITFTFIVAYIVQYRLTGPITMAIDKNQTLVLADSSLVSLNKNSKLTFSQTWNERTVEFQGEGFFRVAKNESKPFRIQLPHGSIKVLGTSFFVKAYPGDTTEVVVSSGTVEVSSENQKVILISGDKSTLLSDNETLVKSVNEDPNFNSWYTRKLQFEKTKFKKIIRLLEDQYHIAFKIVNPELLACRFTGTFDDEALDTILNVLSRSMGFSFELQDDVYLIDGPGCNNTK